MQTTMQSSLTSSPFLAGRSCRKSSIASLAPSVRSRTGRTALVVRAEKTQVGSLVDYQGDLLLAVSPYRLQSEYITSNFGKIAMAPMQLISTLGLYLRDLPGLWDLYCRSVKGL